MGLFLLLPNYKTVQNPQEILSHYTIVVHDITALTAIIQTEYSSIYKTIIWKLEAEKNML